MSIKLDATDKKILEIIQVNARITNLQLAKQVGLSPAPTLERVKKLENMGIIMSYHATLNKEILGLGVSIFLIISLSSHKLNQITSFTNKINEIREIVECHHITGSGDFLLKIISADIPSYHKLILEKLTQIEEIGNMSSMVVLSTYKNSKLLPI